MQPILSPSKVSVHLSSWDISRDFHFHSNLLIYIAANNWQDYIKSFSIHGWRKILFSWPKRDIIFLLSSWDIAILFDRLHRFELGAIRFPRIFFNSNTWYWDENKAKLTNFIELAILEFWCPKRTHNTKSTLLPLHQLIFAFISLFLFLCLLSQGLCQSNRNACADNNVCEVSLMTINIKMKVLCLLLLWTYFAA